MDRTEQRRIVEALVLASPEPISAQRLADLIPYVKPAKAKELIEELNKEYQEHDRAFEIWEVAGGYQIRTRAEFSGYLQKLQKVRPLRLSRAALETLSIVGYKQPATRGEIEEVRGVECGPVLKSLLDRQLVRIAGHRDVPGKPMVYGTTRRFLEVFGLGSLKELPALRDLEELAREQGLRPPEDESALEEGDGEESGPRIIVPDGALDVSESISESTDPANPAGAAEATETTEATEATEATERTESTEATESADEDVDRPARAGD